MIADTVAKEHTVTALYIGVIKPSVKGKRNNKNPVALFKMVCIDTNFLLHIHSQTAFPILMATMAMIQIHNQEGNCINGRIFTKQTAVNTMSPTVSNLAPNSLTDFVFLAIVPSTISVNPQNKYKTLKQIDNTGQNNIHIPHKIRLIVIIFAIFFLIRSPADHDLSFDLFYHVLILCSMHSEIGAVCFCRSKRKKGDQFLFLDIRGQTFILLCAEVICMQMLLETEETIAPGLGFAHFGPCHLIWLAVFILFVVGSSLFYRKLNESGRRTMRLVLAGAILADELLKMTVLLLGGNYLARYLPLHLCSVNIFLIVWHAAKPNQMLDNFLYTVCMPGALFPLLTPTWHTLPPTSLMHIHSFTVHILLATYPIVLLVGGDIRPNLRQLPKSLGLLAVLAFAAYGANLLFDTNFMFLMEAPEGTPLVWFEQMFGSHLVGFPVIISILLLVLYAPFLFGKRKPNAQALSKEKAPA